MMVRAIATECDALVFDLSPAVVFEKFTDKGSVRKAMFMAFTIAKLHEPSIIYIDGVERIFPKKGSTKESK